MRRLPSSIDEEAEAQERLDVSYTAIKRLAEGYIGSSYGRALVALARACGDADVSLDTAARLYRAVILDYQETMDEAHATLDRGKVIAAQILLSPKGMVN